MSLLLIGLLSILFGTLGIGKPDALETESYWDQRTDVFSKMGSLDEIS